ncbi:MAG: GDSL-type esterase/lipase family protein [Halothiobacillaceae bacterium]
MRQVRQTLMVLGVMLLAACSSPELEPLPPDGVILAFGDSLTEGVGASPDGDYPTRLAELTGRTVINAGVSGQTLGEGLARLPETLDRTRPDIMILLMGGNDILRNASPREARDNLEAMITMARDRGVDVVLLGVPEKSLFSSAAPFYEELAETHDLVFERGLVASLLRRPGYKADVVHLNDRGYAALAERVQELLEAHGAL